MSIQFVLLPLFVEVLLTFGVMFGMMYFRTSTLRRGETRLEDISLREPNWPKRATQFGYAFANQFELPVLFYVLTILDDHNPPCRSAVRSSRLDFRVDARTAGGGARDEQ